MRAPTVTRARIQALGMVLIGILLGFAIAASWSRVAGVPPAREAEAARPRPR